MACSVTTVLDGVDAGVEVPVVARGEEVETEDPVDAIQPEFAVRLDGDSGVGVRAAGTGDELADAVDRRLAVGVLDPEALVEMIVSVENDVHAELDQRRPQYFGGGAVVQRAVRAGAEERLVPVGQRAQRTRGLQLLAQPRHLRRARAEGNVVVDRDDPPRAFGERVVALAANAGAGAE